MIGTVIILPEFKHLRLGYASFGGPLCRELDTTVAAAGSFLPLTAIKKDTSRGEPQEVMAAIASQGCPADVQPATSTAGGHLGGQHVVELV